MRERLWITLEEDDETNVIPVANDVPLLVITDRLHGHEWALRIEDLTTLIAFDGAVRDFMDQTGAVLAGIKLNVEEGMPK